MSKINVSIIQYISCVCTIVFDCVLCSARETWHYLKQSLGVMANRLVTEKVYELHTRLIMQLMSLGSKETLRRTEI